MVKKKEPTPSEDEPVAEEKAKEPDVVSINQNLDPDQLHLHDQRPE